MLGWLVAVALMEKVEALRALLMSRKVPQLLARRIIRYFMFLWSSTSHGEFGDEETLLGALPVSLQLQLTVVLHRKIFTEVPLFRLLDPRISCIVVRGMQQLIAMPGEFMLRQGEPARGLFFITRGAVECWKTVVQDGPARKASVDGRERSKGGRTSTFFFGQLGSIRDSKALQEKSGAKAEASRMAEPTEVRVQLSRLGEGDFFGEMSLLTDTPATADIVSVSYSSLMVLKTSDFLAFVSRFPELASAMETCRAEQLGRYNDRRKTRRMTVARRSPKDLLKSWGNASKASMRMGKSRQDFRRAPESTDDGAATKDGLHEASLHSESALVRYDATRSTGM